MFEEESNPIREPLTPAEGREVQRLCARLEDDVISTEEFARLNALLDEKAAARGFYLRYTALANLLQTHAGKQEHLQAEFVRSQHEAILNTPYEPESDAPAELAGAASCSSRRSYGRVLQWATAACLLLATGLFVWYWGPDDLAPAGKVAVDSSPLQPLARLTYVSESARLRAPFDTYKQLHAGDLIALDAGQVELTYENGTKLLLISPAEYRLHASGGQLRRGGLVASVTDAGHGFTVVTPNGKVIDQGTEFGLVVDDFGVSEVSVLQGKVEAIPTSIRSDEQKIELTRGKGLQWDRQNLIPLEADMRWFASSVQQPSDQGHDDPRTTFVELSPAAGLDTRHWRTLGDVRATPDGIHMSSGVDGEPYLVYVDQLDPCDGPLTITCDFRFEQTVADAPPSLSLLTRSTASRGTAPPPWEGTLGSCVRCTFGSGDDERVGSLQAGVKLEEDRELTSISWSSSLPPKPDTLYRVQMRDDGVNVVFTASLVGDPGSARTVTCRSLFRGKSNHFAIEGASRGITIVESVHIVREELTEPLSSYEALSSLMHSQSLSAQRERRLLEDLVPHDAELILADDFSAPELDTQKWATLGDVAVTDGGVQLGLPNLESHIDTWQDRPYLLTRDEFDPRDGAITVIGRVRFSENFLSGYGASFSVMTRAVDRHGEGPGWENSVLRSGIRANFWPASWDANHTLEIHEKPNASTITLLATQGAEIDPNQRDYLFRADDDGRSVSLTIVDPTSSQVMKIHSPVGSAVQSGFLGLESCWGSPVRLDDIRIYRATTPRQPDGETQTD